MFDKHQRGISRIATVMLASGMTVGGGFALAGAAAADNGPGTPSGSGVVASSPTLVSGESGHINFGTADHSTVGGLIRLNAGGKATIDTYCINLKNETGESAKYREAGWSALASASYASPLATENMGRILWVLQNSFPQVSDLDKLAREAGVGTLTKAQAAAATQAAIWDFSDDPKATPDDADAAKLTSYLYQTGKTQDVKEPSAALTLSPQSVTGAVGSLLGPITVASGGGSITANLDAASTAAGVVITDSKGTVLDGTNVQASQLFVKAPAGTKPGTATLSVKASVSNAQVGRVFVSDDHNSLDTHSQTLILAGTTNLSVTATATASWTASTPAPSTSAGTTTPAASPSPSPSQPATPAAVTTGTPGTTGGAKLASTGGGGSAPLLAGIAGALVVAGGGAVFAMRRRGRHGRTAA